MWKCAAPWKKHRGITGRYGWGQGGEHLFTAAMGCYPQSQEINAIKANFYRGRICGQEFKELSQGAHS